MQLIIQEMSRNSLPAQNGYLVPYIGLQQEFSERRLELVSAFETVGYSASYILRDEVARFEANIASRFGVDHAIGVNSGTDALFMALKVLGIGPGDAVITVAHTFVATLSVIVHCGAKPILVDIGQDYNLAVEGLEAAITPATKAIIPVHMNGRCCNMAAILAIAEKYRLHVIEDAAQAMGAHIFDRYAGTFGTIGAFSLHPMKNLHCYGDGGVITTNNKQLAETLRIFRNHGQNKDKTLVGFGFNSRLDNLQAAFLNVNLQYFDADIARRRQVAARYHLGLSGCLALQLPASPQTDGYFDVYSSYPIRCNNRDRLYEHLQARKIECFIHWKQALHLNPALNLQKVELPVTEQVAKEVLSLPIHPFLDNGQCDYVIAAIREFFDDH